MFPRGGSRDRRETSGCGVDSAACRHGCEHRAGAVSPGPGGFMDQLVENSSLLLKSASNTALGSGS